MAASVYNRHTSGVHLLRSSNRSKESVLSSRLVDSGGRGRQRAAKFRALAWASLAVSLFLPGCPLTDDYVILRSFAAAGQPGTSSGAPGESATAGAFSAAGAPDEVGGESASGGFASGGFASGGVSSAGASSIGTAGADVASGGTAGSDPGSGGKAGASEPTAGGTATAGSSGAGGTTASAGNSGSAGHAGSAGANPFFQPLCDEGIVKGSPCDASSVQTCYRRCGPDSIGYKSETCQFGSYVEQSGCTFPTATNYSCYKVPPSLPKECPAGVPRAAQECHVSACVACFGGTVGNPQYQDSTGTPKEGYCVCSSAGVWTCASTPSWPCPNGAGCN
jgi:hypothetical protein